MSLRKFSEIVPDAMHEITRLIDSKHEEKRASVRECVQDDVQAGKACKAGDLVAENRPDDPRRRVGRARRVRAGKQLELGLTINRKELGQ